MIYRVLLIFFLLNNASASEFLVVQSTTSTSDSGFYEFLLPKYEEKFGAYSDTDNLVISEDVWGHIIVEAKKKVGEIFTYPPKPENGLFFKIKSVKNGKIEVYIYGK